MPQVSVSTADRLDIVDVTDLVAEAVTDAFESPPGVRESDTERDTEGERVCTVFVEHTTAGVVVNEAETRLLADVESFLSALVPDEGWEHDALDGNADSHLRALLLGNSVSVPVVDGRLALGRWQSILLMECDGPRTRRLRVVVSGA